MGKVCVQWTTREITLLRQLVQERKLSAKRIYEAGALSRHGLNSIKAQMSYLGLGNSEIRERIKNARRMNPREKSLLLGFLQRKGWHTPSGDVARKFGIRPQVVCYYRRKLGLKLAPHERFSSKRFQETHHHVVVRLRDGLRKYHDNFWKDRPEQLFTLFRRAVDENCRAGLRQCKNCRSYWFATVQFFYRARTRDDGTVRLHTHCRACGYAVWRRKERGPN